MSARKDESLDVAVNWGFNHCKNVQDIFHDLRDLLMPDKEDEKKS